jgi:hypothetical protein
VDDLRTGIIGYLTERDAALERERDRVLVDLLDEFVEGMGRREARRAAGQAGEARDRARDRRDAARLRQLMTEGRLSPAAGRNADALPALTAREGPPAQDGPGQDGPGQAGPGQDGPGQDALGTDAMGHGTGQAGTAAGDPSDAHPTEAATPDTHPSEAATPDADDTGPIDLPAPQGDGRTCPDCGFVAKTPAGLSAHRRSHRR